MKNNDMNEKTNEGIVTDVTTSWTDPNFPTLDFTKYAAFSRNHNQTSVPIKSSEILFAGSCDISGVLKNKYWHQLYCEARGLNHSDYVTIGTIGQPLSALVRKIYCWLKLIETPPKTILMVAPVTMPEHVWGRVAWPIPRKLDLVEFLERIKIIPYRAISRIVPLVVAQSQMACPGQLIYEFAQSFSFLEMMTKVYGIELWWTPNLTKSAVSHYEPNIENFLASNEFAKRTFLGYEPSIVDVNAEGMDFPSELAHINICEKFLSLSDK